MNPKLMPLNPFCSRFVNPLNSPFVPQSLSIQASGGTLGPCQLAKQFQQQGECVQIVGPHGSGKTTLALAIAAQLTESVSPVEVVTFRRSPAFGRWLFPRLVVQKSMLTTNHPKSSDSHTGSLILIDGIELLNWLHRRLMIRSLCRTPRRTKVIVTTHRPIRRLPILVTLRPSSEHFDRIVHRLCAGEDLLPSKVVSAAYWRSNGDYRKGLSLLYDEWQHRHVVPTHQAVGESTPSTRSARYSDKGVQRDETPNSP